MYHTTQINERTGSSAGGTRDRDRGLPFPAAGTGTPGAAAERRTVARAWFPCRTCCLLLFLILMVLLTGFRPAVGDVTGNGTETDPFKVSTWSDLQDKLDNDNQCQTARGGCYIRLDDTITCNNNSSLNVPSGAKVTLDLNGKTIDRGLTAASYGGYVISVQGTLTLKDTAGGGVITGGNNSSYGGGVYVEGIFTMNGGTISCNKASGGGGGVYVEMYGTFTMNDGTISDNEAFEGGGVYVLGTFTMNGGTISGDKASSGGGGVYVCGSFTMHNGTISGNKAIGGGGVYVNTSATFNTNGGTISGNEATDYGGGVFIYSGKFQISSTPKITGNKNSNVFLFTLSNYPPPSNITVIGELNDSAIIGVTLGGDIGDTGVFTNTSDGNTNYNDPSRFTSDNPAYWVGKNADGQLYIVTTVITPPEATVLTYTGSPQELVTAGTVQGGMMQYALGTDDQTVPASGWSGSIPTGTDVGTYYVWYKAIVDEYHSGPAAKSIKVKIIDPDNTMTLPVEVDNILKRNGARGFPDEISTLEVTLTITIKSGDTETTTVEPLTLTLDRNSAVLTQDALFDRKITDPGPGKQGVTVSVSPRVVYGRDKIYSSDGPVEGPVKWKYEISAAGEINEKDGKMIVRVYLIWDDGYRPEVIKVYALPEDEIGAYALRADGTKEYLLFHTYGICMQWLGSDELCRGYERCFHKESPYVNPFVKP